MCEFCSSFDFESVGFKYDGGKGVFYFPSHLGDVPDDERFQFCPACGRSLLPAGVPEMDYYKVQQLEKMLEHETSVHEVHYGAYLSHWYGDTKTITLDAGGLKTLLEHYRHHKTDMGKLFPKWGSNSPAGHGA